MSRGSRERWRERRRRRRMCFNKEEYHSEDMAESVARRVQRERNVELRSYRCPICRGWHLTSRVH